MQDLPYESGEQADVEVWKAGPWAFGQTYLISRISGDLYALSAMPLKPTTMLMVYLYSRWVRTSVVPIFMVGDLACVFRVSSTSPFRPVGHGTAPTS